jgi:hypothetical protein
MQHFRLNHLKPNHIGIVPHRGYDQADNQSKLALRFFKWYEEKYGLEVQTALSDEGEHKVDRFRLDGYIKSLDKGLEVNGCRWHAHSCLYNDPNLVINRGKTVAHIREKDAARLEFLRTRLRGGVEIYWECQIHQMLRKDVQMDRCFRTYLDEGPINIRDAFFGGR